MSKKLSIRIDIRGVGVRLLLFVYFLLLFPFPFRQIIIFFFTKREGERNGLNTSLMN